MTANECGNECGDDVPNNIDSMAREKGSIKCPKYVYKNGKYGRKLPASSIDCKKRAGRFKKKTSVEEMKVPLGDGWVAFKSPTGSKLNPD